MATTQVWEKLVMTVTESGHILVVDDEPQMRRVLRTILVAHGYEVWDARNGDEALEFLRTVRFDLVLLDINMPGIAGMALCREIRAGFNVAIVVLTVRDTEKDKVAAFDAGASDYITKPFDSLELLARLRAHLRRIRAAEEGFSELFTSGDLVINFVERTVTRLDRTVRLSPKQCQLLRYLVSNRGKTLSHRSLLKACWVPTTERRPCSSRRSSLSFARKSKAIPASRSTS